MHLAAKELRSDGKPWLSVVMVCAVVAVWALWGAATFGCVTGMSGPVPDGYRQIGFLLIGSAMVVGGSAITSAGAVAIQLQRRTVASWRLAGLSGRQASSVVLWQTLGSGMIGALVGSCLGLAGWPLFVTLLRAANVPEVDGVSRWPVAWAPLVAAFSVVAICLLGSRRGVKDAGKVEPLAMFRSAPKIGKRLGWLRLAFLVVLVLGWVVSLLVVALTPHDPVRQQSVLENTTGLYLLVAFLSAAVAGLVGRVLLPGLLRAWSCLVPRRAAPAWFLARNRAEYDVELSTSIASPLIVATVCVSAFYGWLDVLQGVAEAFQMPADRFSATLASIALNLGGPVVIAGIATCGTLFAVSRSKQSEATRLIVAGADKREIVLKAVLEALIYAGTIALACLLVVGANSVLFWVALRVGPVPGLRFVGLAPQPFTVVLGALALMVVCNLVVVVRPLRRTRLEDLREW